MTLQEFFRGKFPLGDKSSAARPLPFHHITLVQLDHDDDGSDDYDHDAGDDDDKKERKSFEKDPV